MMKRPAKTPAAAAPPAASPPPKAYSYVRFSTPEQSKGDSFRRQTSAATAYCQKHGLDLDTRISFHDLGVSAFKGQNAETGALRAFLRAVEDGHIPRGSYLLVESLDRITRGHVLQAQTIFNSIVMAITLVTLGDQREYSEESLIANPTDLLISLLVMMRGNDESATKARRLKAAWANKRVLAGEKKLFTRLVPGWIRVTPEETLEAIPERAEMVQRIYSMFLSGVGKGAIAKAFNSEGLETWGMAGRKPGQHWHASYIAKILDNTAVLGILTTRTVEFEDGREVIREAQRIDDYYPRVIDNETFARVRAIRDTATVVRPKGRSTPRNLVAGLAVCPLCAGAMIRVNKGSAKRGKPYLVCSKAKVGAGCSYKAVGLEEVEFAVRSSFAEFRQALLAEGSKSLAADVQRLEDQSHVLADQMENVADAIATQGASSVLSRRLRELQTEMDRVVVELRERRAQLFTETHAMRRARIEELRVALDGTDVQAANVLLRELFKVITVDYRTGQLRCVTKADAEIDISYRWVDVEQDEEETT
jgi:DNA invertase Pin-like site-specific DNA recombinase